MFGKRSNTSITLEKLENIYNELNQRTEQKKSCQKSKLIFRNRIKNDFTFKYPVKDQLKMDTNPKSKWNIEKISWRKNQIIESKKIGNHFSKLNKKLECPKLSMPTNPIDEQHRPPVKLKKFSIDLGNYYSKQNRNKHTTSVVMKNKGNFPPEENCNQILSEEGCEEPSINQSESMEHQQENESENNMLRKQEVVTDNDFEESSCQADEPENSEQRGEEIKVKATNDGFLVIPCLQNPGKGVKVARETLRNVEQQVTGTLQLILQEVEKKSNKETKKSQKDEQIPETNFLHDILHQILQNLTVTRGNEQISGGVEKLSMKVTEPNLENPRVISEGAGDQIFFCQDFTKKLACESIDCFQEVKKNVKNLKDKDYKSLKDIKETENGETSDQPLLKKSEKFFNLNGIKIDLKIHEKFYKSELIE